MEGPSPFFASHSAGLSRSSFLRIDSDSYGRDRGANSSSTPSGYYQQGARRVGRAAEEVGRVHKDCAVDAVDMLLSILIIHRARSKSHAHDLVQGVYPVRRVCI
jgi:hypothetical protein